MFAVLYAAGFMAESSQNVSEFSFHTGTFFWVMLILEVAPSRVLIDCKQECFCVGLADVDFENSPGEFEQDLVKK